MVSDDLFLENVFIVSSLIQSLLDTLALPSDVNSSLLQTQDICFKHLDGVKQIDIL